MSGSTAWNYTVRSRLYLVRPNDDDGKTTEGDERVLSRKKANYASLGENIDLTWKDGVLVAEEEVTGIFASIEKRSAESDFLDGLRQLKKQGRYGSDSKKSSNYAPKLIAKLKCGKRHRYTGLARAMDVLFETEKIRVKEVRCKGYPRHEITIVEDEEEGSEASEKSAGPLL